ncbi:MAG: ABC transporter permease [Geminicoccaceae bacterium]|nr:ABC transporter permease [Geminicoccaceae bacterium]MCB9943570.1 ABC transporter permease [Geminicoccaceae bacterium]
MSAILTLAVSEWRVGRRSRWVLISGIALALFALILTLLGSAPAGSVKASPVAVATVSLTTLFVYLIPLLALLLAQDAIAGESERGTLILLLTYPLPRAGLLAGKFVGHLLILMTALGIGLATATLVLLTHGTPSAEDWHLLIRLALSTVLFAAIYLVLGYVVSGIARDRGAAMAMAFSLWLVTVVLYDLLLLVLLGLGWLDATFPWMLVINPCDAFRLINLGGIPSVEIASGLAAALPDLPLPASGLWAVLTGWFLAGGALAGTILQRRQA